MSDQVSFSTLLVPTDFSPPSVAALEWATRLVTGDDSALILMHVVDEGLIASLVNLDFGEREQMVRRLRESAERKLEELKADANDDVKIDTLICEGIPFVEIVQKATDFAVDAVVMSKVGTRRQFETLLFGSTAEKVARGCRQPVLVLPTPDEK